MASWERKQKTGRFDKFINLDYIKIEKDGEARYVRRDQATDGNLRAGAIQDRVDKLLDAKRDAKKSEDPAVAERETAAPATPSTAESVRQEGIASQSPEALDDINTVFGMAAQKGCKRSGKYKLALAFKPLCTN